MSTDPIGDVVKRIGWEGLSRAFGASFMIPSEDKYPSETAEDLIRIKPDPANPPFKGELTIIWETEKRELHERLDAQSKVIEGLAERVKTLESWALKIWRQPTVSTKAVGTLIPEVDYEGPTEGRKP